jgi:hypothetical protein
MLAVLAALTISACSGASKEQATSASTTAPAAKSPAPPAAPGPAAKAQPVPAALAATLFEEYARRDDPERMDEFRKRKGFTPAKYFSATAVDVTGDGQAELIVRTTVDGDDEPLCVTHNCPVWVYRVSGDRYEPLLGDVAGYIEGITVLTATTNGAFDIKVQQHSSAVARDAVLYRFDGKRYQARECSTDTYDETPAGEVIKVRSMPRACELRAADFAVAGLDDMAPLAQVRTLLGAPASVKKSKNELGGGEFITWLYPGLEVFSADGEHATNITLTTTAHQTARGLRVGDPEARVAQLYGEPTGTFEDTRDYADLENQLHVIRVTVKKGRVTSIAIGWLVD